MKKFGSILIIALCCLQLSLVLPQDLPSIFSNEDYPVNIGK